MGAVAPGGVMVLNQGVIAALRLADEQVDQLVRRAVDKVARQEKAYRAGRPPPRRSRAGAPWWSTTGWRREPPCGRR